ncbi:MAG: GAF domain-containing protein, partial [Bacteroidota bacterium]
MKRLKYWNTRSQVGLLFFGVGLLIAINFFFIYRANRITRVREATAQLVQESIANINLMGFYASNIANGADQFKAGLQAYIEQLEENMEFLEDGGTIIQNDRSLRIYSLPERAVDSYDAFRDLWATYKASLEVLQNTPSQNVFVFNGYEPYEEITDSGTIVTLYRPVSQTANVPNPAVLSKVTEVSKQTGTLATNLETLREELNNHYWLRRFGFQAATVLFSILSVAGLVAAFYILLLRLFNPLHEVQTITQKISEGDLDCQLPDYGYGEVVNLSKTLNQLLERLVSATSFANQIGKGEFESEFHAASDKDKLGYALLEMRDNLSNVAEEDSKRNWANEGMAKFGDILRNTFNSEEDLAYAIVSNLVKYLNVNQGGLFAIEEDFNGDQSLNLLASYAYGRRKFLERKLELGEGLIGQAALEGEVIYLTDIPEEYALIQSGMGEGSPSSIIILPLKSNDQIFGVLELASFDK